MKSSHIVLAVLLSFLVVVPSHAESVPVSESETSTMWLVELSSPPAAEGTSSATLKKEKAAFNSAASKAGIDYAVRMSFDTLWNGLSVRTDAIGAMKMARLDGVQAVWPMVTMTLPEPTPGDEADLLSAIEMTGADLVHSSLGFTGAGIRVGVIDTGVDYHHPDLGGCFGPGCRVVTGWDFVGDSFGSAGGSIVPDPNPDDCNGHGTHVAGIIGANGKVRGVAPDVTIGAYRVFGCEGSTSADIMIAAMERAYADGMQVVNMSIGSALQWPNYPTAVASTRLVNKGVVVVASIGNNGPGGSTPLGLYASGAPGVGDKVIGTASFDNIRVTLPYFTISPDDRPVLYGSATAAAPTPTTGSFPVVATGTTTSVADACSPIAENLAGKVALIRRGTCGFYQKSFNAQSAGAVGVILYNNTTGRVSPTVAGSPAITIPVVAITAADGALIASRINSGGVTMTWTAEKGQEANTNAGLISNFSSYGVTPSLDLKPDIGAPGGSIYSTYPLEIGGYATLNGTSMASPHVAGAAALLLQAHPHTPSQAVRTILQNSADPKPWSGNPGLGYLDQVHRQGAGLVDIDDAILATTRIEPGKLSLGESELGPVTRSLQISNSSNGAVTYALSHAPALNTAANPFSPSATTGFATASFSQSGIPVTSVTVPANSTMSVDVTIAANPAVSDRTLFGGYLVFTASTDGSVYRVPYSGFKGDYQSIQVLAPTGNGFPWLARQTGGSYLKQSDGAVYTMTGADLPLILLHLDHQSRRMKIELFDAPSGKARGKVYESEYLTRNSSAGGFFSFPIDGTAVLGKKISEAPNGSYVMVVSTQKALGDDSNPLHWESWTSPVFTIARP